jgi:hypothetical protein
VDECRAEQAADEPEWEQRLRDWITERSSPDN